MDISLIKKRIIAYLFGLTMLLLAANVIIAKIRGTNSFAPEHEMDAAAINKIFLNDLDNFGLRKDWIKKVNIKNAKKIPAYQIKLPKDLPIPVVLSEMYSSFYASDIKIKSIEMAKGGKTQVEVYQQSSLKLSTEFNYDNDIRRDAGDLGIIVFGLERLSTKDLNAMIGFPQTFISVLVPSKSALKLIPGLLENRKEYAVLIDDNITDMDYKLSNDFSGYRIKLTIRSIVADFPNAVFFLIDDRSKLNSSPAGEIVRDEFSKRNIKLITQHALPELISSGSEIKNTFRADVEKVHSGSSKLILIHAEDFDVLKPEIFSLIKVGYKFISPSIIISANMHKESFAQLE